MLKTVELLLLSIGVHFAGSIFAIKIVEFSKLQNVLTVLQLEFTIICVIGLDSIPVKS